MSPYLDKCDRRRIFAIYFLTTSRQKNFLPAALSRRTGAWSVRTIRNPRLSFSSQLLAGHSRDATLSSGRGLFVSHHCSILSTSDVSDALYALLHPEVVQLQYFRHLRAVEVIAKGNNVTVLDHATGERKTTSEKDPMAVPEALSADWRPVRVEGIPEVFTGGWVSSVACVIRSVMATSPHTHRVYSGSILSPCFITHLRQIAPSPHRS